ncbi:MAG: hypothetical protein ACE14L_04250 [Terriglobales bacterium]
MKRSYVAAAMLGVFCALSHVPRTYAQWKQAPSTGAQPRFLDDRTTIVGQSGLGPMLKADLVDAKANARQRKAVVDAKTDGVQLIEPAPANYVTRLDQAHLQYQLDGGTVIDTVSTRMTFSDLTPGRHHITVRLADNGNHGWGQPVTLTVDIPQ